MVNAMQINVGDTVRLAPEITVEEFGHRFCSKAPSRRGMTSSLHRMDPPALPICDGRVVIGGDATASRLRASAGFTNCRNDGWESRRWAQAEAHMCHGILRRN